MRISGPAYVVNLAEAAAARAVEREKGAAGSARGDSRTVGASLDRVEISSGYLELERLKSQMAAIPEVRMDRVALARQNLEGGYQVEPEVVAQKMVERWTMP